MVNKKRQRGQFKSGFDFKRSKQNPPHLPGEKSPNSRLNNEQIIAIRKRAEHGETLANIAQEFCVTLQNVWSIVHRKTWRHI